MLTVNSESCFYLHFQGRRPGYFSFLDPFSPGVWLFMLLAYLAVSCVLFLVARYSLPFPVLTPPPRVHLWELHQRGWGAGVGRLRRPWCERNQRDGRGIQDMNHSAQLSTWHHPSVHLCAHPIRGTMRQASLSDFAFAPLPLIPPLRRSPAPCLCRSLGRQRKGGRWQEDHSD